MALAAKALVTLAAAKNFIQPQGMTSGDDARIEEVINRASALIERWCNRPLAKVTYTDLRLRGPCSTDLYLAHTPIAASQAITVTVSGTSMAVWRSEADGDPATYDVVLMASCEDSLLTPDVLFRGVGWDTTVSYVVGYYSRMVPMVLISYSGGFALTPTAGYRAVPEDLTEAALEVIKKLWGDESKGTQDVTTVNLPSGGFTVFDAAIPRRAALLLEPYRRLVVA